MKKTSFSLRMIALLLSLILTAVSIPFAIIAEDGTNADIQQNEINANENVTTDENPLIEDLSKRDSFAKHYAASNGERYAVVFSEQVHYEENGEWVEVDNRLTLDTATQRYTSANERFSADFAANTGSDSLVSISDGEYSLSWSVMFPSTGGMGNISTEVFGSFNVASANAQLMNSGETAAVTTLSNMESMGKAVSSVRYNGVYGGGNVDLRYTVMHEKVEEDIILNSLGSFTSYVLAVNTGELTAVKNADGSVSFGDSDGNAVFTIAAPWMKDANGEVSADIEVELIQRGELALVGYIPSREWLTDPERAYPVLIDPSFTTRFYTNNYIDTYVYTGSAADTNLTRASETSMKVGTANGKEYQAYIKILNIPQFKAQSILEATFSVYSDTLVSGTLNLYKVTQNWYPDTVMYNENHNNQLICNASNEEFDPDESSSVGYKFNISEWIGQVCSGGQNTDNFFDSSEWNGFMITSPSADSTIDIISSEIHYAGTRPTITIKYTVYTNSVVEDTAIYSFINQASNKYLTVTDVADSGVNVYQYSDSDSVTQKFRLDDVNNDGSFVIRTMSDSDGTGRVLHFNYTSSINKTTGYVPVNLTLNNYSSGSSNSQQWLIECVNGADLYKIVSRADPNLALTAVGIANGSSSGTGVTTAGNVIVTEYNYSDSQHWKLESGGAIFTSPLDVKDTDTNAYYCVLDEGDDWFSFACPVYSLNDTVYWESTNPHVATVDEYGNVTAHKAGIAEIKAYLWLDNRQYTEVHSNTVYVVLEDGVYYIEDYTGFYTLGVKNEEISEGSPITTYLAEKDDGDRKQYFKIKHIGNGVYSIRTMIKSNMGIARSGNTLIVSNLGYYDNMLDDSKKWVINSNANGYYVSGVGMEEYALKAQNTPKMTQYLSTSERFNWTFSKIESSYNGVDIRCSESELFIRDSAQLTGWIYSSLTNDNGQNDIIWGVTNGTGSATINSTTGEIYGVSAGTVTVTAKYVSGEMVLWESNRIFEINGMLIYRSRDREKLGFADASNDNDITPITAEDLIYDDLNDEEICSNGTHISLTDLYENGEQIPRARRIEIVENFFNSQLGDDPTFNAILLDMFDHFVMGSGENYSNAELTLAVKNHEETQNYVNEFIKLFKKAINEKNGDIDSLYYDEELWIKPIERKEHVIVKSMLNEINNGNENLYLPVYGFNNDVPGLFLAIDGWYGNKIEVDSFLAIGNTYNCTLRFTFYDHFGLDAADLTSKKAFNFEAGMLPGFRQWYIMQHWQKLLTAIQPRPFVTIVTYTVNITGTY